MLNLFNDQRFSDLQAKKCCQIINSYAKVLNNKPWIKGKKKYV